MGEQSQFDHGDRAPNNGEYMEVGDNSHHQGVKNPKHIHMKKGQRFPPNTNADRKWVKKDHAITH